MREISVLVVDDQPAFRKAASAVIAAIDELVLCGEAGDHASAMASLDQLVSPAVAIIDVRLGEECGADLCRRFVARRSDVAVILVSAAADVDLPLSVYDCGAEGFIAKCQFGPDSLSDALRLTGHLR